MTATQGLTPAIAHTHSADETKELAGALAHCCLVGDVVLLAGDLGAGKTTFAQGFGGALGVGERITSPTFTLVRQYPCRSGGPVDTLLHADVYRLDHLSEVVDLGLSELVEDGAVALIEWGDVAAPAFGHESLVVRLESESEHEDRRVIRITTDSTHWASRWAAITSVCKPWAVES